MKKTKMQVGPEYTPITSEYLDYDEVIKKYDTMMDWLAHLYVGTLNMIHYMHDKYYYEATEMRSASLRSMPLPFRLRCARSLLKPRPKVQKGFFAAFNRWFGKRTEEYTSATTRFIGHLKRTGGIVAVTLAAIAVIWPFPPDHPLPEIRYKFRSDENPFFPIDP